MFCFASLGYKNDEFHAGNKNVSLHKNPSLDPARQSHFIFLSLQFLHSLPVLSIPFPGFSSFPLMFSSFSLSPHHSPVFFIPSHIFFILTPFVSLSPHSPSSLSSHFSSLFTLIIIQSRQQKDGFGRHLPVTNGS